MEYLSFSEILERGFKTVIVQAYGYQEGRVMPSWQPFRTRRNITFKVNPVGYLEHQTFILMENEEDLEYILKDDGKVYLNDPDIMADRDY